MQNPEDPARFRAFQYVTSGSLIARILLAVAGLALLIVAFFFVTLALAAGAVIGLALAARWWWLARRLRRQANADVVEGEFVVVQREESARIEPPRER